MDISEAFHNYSENKGEVKRPLSQAERTAKNERWSELHYKLQDDKLSVEERKQIEQEKEDLRKEITQ